MVYREGWKRAFQSLHVKNIPTFVFSSGYGDVVTQSLLQGGINDVPDTAQSSPPQPHGPSQQLPLNMRIISNFFRTAPDGTVRAFSTPIVHEKNKNAKTAATALGFAVPERSNALVLGSHEDDIYMTDGASGIVEQLSVGFIEVRTTVNLLVMMDTLITLLVTMMTELTQASLLPHSNHTRHPLALPSQSHYTLS